MGQTQHWKWSNSKYREMVSCHYNKSARKKPPWYESILKCCHLLYPVMESHNPITMRAWKLASWGRWATRLAWPSKVCKNGTTRPAWLSSTTSTQTVSPGTMWPATSAPRLSAKTRTPYWLGWSERTLVPSLQNQSQSKTDPMILHIKSSHYLL